jgi:hypothetical protein
MAFCTTCGTNVEGKFCVKCGTPVGASAAQPAAAAPAPAAPVAAQAAPARKKTSPIVWILVALLGLFLLVAIGVVAGGFFLVHKAKQAGLDPSLWEKNPGLAATKMITAANPDVQVLKTDEDKGTITLRDKKTGKVYSIDFDAVKQGRITFQEEGGESVSIGAGSAANIPGWVPSYPGAKPEGTFSSAGGENEGGMFAFKTGDGAKKVLGWYEQSLKAAGFTVENTVTGDDGGMVTGEDASKRSVIVTVGTEGSQTTVSVAYGNKKD